jgi:hypothetical protein
MTMHRFSNALMILAAVLAVTACGMFETRDPEPPDTGSSTFIPPTSPELVLSNLEYAVAERNPENYIRCLVDTLSGGQRFIYIPTAAAAGRYPASFSDWTLQSERSYFSALAAFTRASGVSRLELRGNFSIMTADSAVYDGAYDLLFRHGVSGVSEEARGLLQLVLRSDRASIWSIARWIDIPSPEQTSWSEWKGRFAN